MISSFISMSRLRRTNEFLKFQVIKVYFWNALLLLFGLKSQFNDIFIILVTALWIVYKFFKKIFHGNLTLGHHLWLLYFDVLNESDDLYFSSSPLECVCLLRFLKGEMSSAQLA